MNYKDFNIFIIDSNNGKDQEEVFYGYKTIDDNGFGLNVYGENSKLYIKGSLIQPCISIYKTDNYGAISNCLYVLTEYLKSKNITLTENPTYANWLNENYDGRDHDYNHRFSLYNEDDTCTCGNEIVFNDNFSYIEIDGNLNLIKFDNDFFTKEIYNSKDDLLKFGNKYNDYFHSLVGNKLSADLSGGFDSRILYSFYKDIDNMLIAASWRRATTNPMDYNDGLIARGFLEKYHKRPYTIKDRGEIVMTEAQGSAEKEVTNLLNYGVAPVYKKDNLTLQSDVKDILELPDFRYHLNGMMLEAHKGDPGKLCFSNTKSVAQCLRRSKINRYIAKYYVTKRVTILPFIDKDFMRIKAATGIDFPLMLIKLFNVFDPEIPVYSHDVMYFITQEDVARAMSLLENKKEN